MMGLTIRVQDLGNATMFRCSGRIVAGQDRDLHDAVVTKSHSQLVLLDLAEVSAIDAAGVGVLLKLRRWANARGRKLILTNLATRVAEILQLVHLEDLFEVYPTEHDMLLSAVEQATPRPNQHAPEGAAAASIEAA